MKKISILLIIASLFAFVSCTTVSTLLGGSWTFKTVSYAAITAVASTTAKTLTATTGNKSEIDNVVCSFSTFPPSAGTYTITNNRLLIGANEVYVIMNLGLKTYTIANGVTGIANVTVVGGKVNITIPTVGFSSSILGAPASDAGDFSATITQNL
jgi:hypothetical protein